MNPYAAILAAAKRGDPLTLTVEAVAYLAADFVIPIRAEQMRQHDARPYCMEPMMCAAKGDGHCRSCHIKRIEPRGDLAELGAAGRMARDAKRMERLGLVESEWPTYLALRERHGRRITAEEAAASIIAERRKRAA